MAKHGSYYAVQNGRQTGVYSNWDNCKSQVNGYSGAVYRKFDTKAEARAFSKGDSSSSSSSSSSAGRSSNYNSNAGYGYSHASSDSSSHSPSRTTSYSSSHSSSSTASSASTPYYGVRSNNPHVQDRVFNNWGDCKDYVHGQKGLSFQKFPDKATAKQFVNRDDHTNESLLGCSKHEFASKYKNNSSNHPAKHTEVYCDGSSLGNGQASSRAGYGIHFKGAPEKNISKPLKGGAQTNNRAELKACSEAMDVIWKDIKNGDNNTKYRVKTDSEYTMKLLNDKYSTLNPEQAKAMPNGDIIAPLVERYSKVKEYYKVNGDGDGSDFKVEWVKAHDGEEGNEIADRLAKEGAMKN